MTYKIDYSTFDLSKRTVIIDADTLLYSAASAQEKMYYTLTNKHNGRDKKFQYVKEYKAWLEEYSLNIEDFEITSEKVVEGKLEFALGSVKQKISNILEACGAEDCRICIGGKDNFRMSFESQWVKYKAQRNSKPVFLEECREFVKNKYGSKVMVADGIEADDILTMVGWWYYTLPDSTTKNLKDRLILACIDKDIKANVVGYFYNYGTPEGIVWNSGSDVIQKFCKQLLIGDNVDNIPSVKLTDACIKHFKLTKSNGLAEGNATKLLKGLKDRKELAEMVVKVYQLCYDKEWLHRLQDIGFLLWLKRNENDVFCAKTWLLKCGVVL